MSETTHTAIEWARQRLTLFVDLLEEVAYLVDAREEAEGLARRAQRAAQLSEAIKLTLKLGLGRRSPPHDSDQVTHQVPLGDADSIVLENFKHFPISAISEQHECASSRTLQLGWA